MKYYFMALLVVLSLQVLASPMPNFPFVIVTESLEMKVKPDVANVSFSLLAFDNKSDASMQALTNTTAKLLTVLKKYDIPVSQLESSEIDKSVKRANKDGAYNLEVLGYELRQSFTLKVNNLEVYPALLNELILIDGLQSINSTFKTEKEAEYKESMIVELSAKARQQANALALAQERKVHKVYGITTEDNFGAAFATFSVKYEPRGYSSAMKADFHGMNLVMAIPEYILVNQRITAIYELK